MDSSHARYRPWRPISRIQEFFFLNSESAVDTLLGCRMRTRLAPPKCNGTSLGQPSPNDPLVNHHLGFSCSLLRVARLSTQRIKPRPEPACHRGRIRSGDALPGCDPKASRSSGRDDRCVRPSRPAGFAQVRCLPWCPRCNCHHIPVNGSRRVSSGADVRPRAVDMRELPSCERQLLLTEIGRWTLGAVQRLDDTLCAVPRHAIARLSARFARRHDRALGSDSRRTWTQSLPALSRCPRPQVPDVLPGGWSARSLSSCCVVWSLT